MHANVVEELDRHDVVLICDIRDLLVLVRRVRALAVLYCHDRGFLGLGMGDDEGVGLIELPLDPARVGDGDLRDRCELLYRTYISGLEQTRRNPTLGVIVKLAHALDVRPAELLATIE